MISLPVNIARKEVAVGDVVVMRRMYLDNRMVTEIDKCAFIETFK